MAYSNEVNAKMQAQAAMSMVGQLPSSCETAMTILSEAVQRAVSIAERTSRLANEIGGAVPTNQLQATQQAPPTLMEVLRSLSVQLRNANDNLDRIQEHLGI